MKPCPHCGAPLTESVWLRGKCPKCKQAIDAPAGTTASASFEASETPTASGPIQRMTIEPGHPARKPQSAIQQTMDGPQIAAARAADPITQTQAPTLNPADVVETRKFSPSDSHATLPPIAPSNSPPVVGALNLPDSFAEYEAPADSERPTQRGGLANRVSQLWQGNIPSDARNSTSLKGGMRTLSSSTRVSIRTRTLADANHDGLPFSSDYELLGKLGEGGMGVVFTARQTSVDRTIAIKMLKPDMAKNENLREKFLVEAAVTGDLDHPNIVPIYDLGANDQGALFYAMKRVKGTPWNRALEELPLDRNLDVLLRTADAVAFAHSRGVVHRDLKPENVMLGDFGEVLVMDWGLAISVTPEAKAAHLDEGDSIGGTPCYMAPEMAAGPTEKIGIRSDVYLLGAILYEILTGHPPHDGGNVMTCLINAGSNAIVPTTRKGELVDISLRAMSHEPDDRHASALEFQEAIRSALSHQESTILADRAQDTLTDAVRTNDYHLFAQSMFAFHEALELWEGNRRAAEGLRVVKLGYAEAAFKNGDFDLATSLLSPDEPNEAQLLKQVQLGRADRHARALRLRYLTYAAGGLAATLLVVMSVAFFWVQGEKEKALAAKVIAENARQQAVEAKQIAEKNEKLAIAARNDAVLAQQAEVIQRQKADKAKTEADHARTRAEASAEQERLARDKEREAREAAVASEVKAVYEGYVAKVGLAATKIDENSFEQAQTLLDSCPLTLRDWEWGRLKYLGQCDLLTFRGHKMRIDGLACGQNDLVLTGSWDETAQLWNSKTGAVLKTFQLDRYIRAVSLSADGKQLLTGSDDGLVTLWSVETGKPIRTLKGHQMPILSVNFSADGKRCLSSSADFTARLWDVEKGQPLMVLAGHQYFVWTAAFSPDEKRAITSCEDGTCYVWDLTKSITDISAAAQPGTKPRLQPVAFRQPAEGPPKAQRIFEYRGHRGAVNAAIFSHDGKLAISGGFDKTIRIWRPEPANPRLPPVPDIVLRGHTSGIRSLALSRDGKQLLSGGNDNTARLWNFITHTLVQTYRGHSGPLTGVRFTADETQLATSSEDTTARIWSIANYSEQRTLRGHVDEVLCGRFAGNGKTVITSSRDQTARIWDAQSGSFITALEEGHTGPMLSTAISADSKLVATGSVDGSVRLWNTQAGGELNELTGHGGPVRAVCFSPDGQLLATGGDDQLVRVYKVSDATLLATLKAHPAPIWAVSFAPDGKRLVSSDAVGKALVWNIDTPAKPVANFQEHGAKITAAFFLPDNERIVTCSLDRSAAVWNSRTGKEVFPIRAISAITCASLSPDGSQLLVAGEDHVLRLFSLTDGKLLNTLVGHQDLVASVCFDMDGKHALSAGLDRNIFRWDLTVQPPAPQGVVSFNDVDVFGIQAAHDKEHLLVRGIATAFWWNLKTQSVNLSFSRHGAVTGADLSADGSQAVTCGYDNTIKLWDVKSSQVAWKRAGIEPFRLNGVQFAGDAQHLLTASDDQTARLWEVGKHDPLVTYGLAQQPDGQMVHSDRVRGVTLSNLANGKFVYTASNDQTAARWSWEGKLLQTYKGHTWWVLAVAVSPDGAWLCTGSEDNTARLWNIADGTCRWVLRGHTGYVSSVAFSHDGRRVLTGSRDTTARLWDTATGQEILSLRGHQQEVTSVAFSPDGLTAMTTSGDNTAILWPAVPWAPPTPVEPAATAAAAELK